MKRKIVYSILILIIFIIILSYSPKNKLILDSSTANSQNRMLSVMVEREAGTGNYIDASSFPSTDYYLNKKLSKCVNGSKISFSDGNLLIKGNKSDRCYAYFDKDELGSICRGQNMAECFIQNYKKDSSIIYHDGASDYDGEENYELEAGDLSYRYTGGNDVVHNYVCFGSNEEKCSLDNLYRIIGLFKNNDNQYEIKLIKADYANTDILGSDGGYEIVRDENWLTTYINYHGDKKSISYYHWNNLTLNNNWNESNLNTINLNTNFYKNYLSNSWQKMIANHIYKVGGYEPSGINVKTMYDGEVLNNSLDYDDGKIGLMYVSDYGYAMESQNWSISLTDDALVNTDNWLNLGIADHTITRNSAANNISLIIKNGKIETIHGVNLSNLGFPVRPSFYLVSSIKLKFGNGTKENPYQITLEQGLNNL